MSGLPADEDRESTMTATSPEELADRGLRWRAVEAAVWGMAAVNHEVMRSVMSPDGKTEFLYCAGPRPQPLLGCGGPHRDCARAAAASRAVPGSWSGSWDEPGSIRAASDADDEGSAPMAC